MLGFTSETLVFAYLGLAIVVVDLKYDIPLILWSLLLCMVGRFANIYPLGALANYFRKTIKISWKNKFLLWWSGLRGAVAFALALATAGPDTKPYLPNADIIVSTTLIVVLVTVSVFGNLAFYVVKCIGVQDETTSVSLANTDLRPHQRRFQGKHRIFKAFVQFDRKYLKPLLLCTDGLAISSGDINLQPEGDLIALSNAFASAPEPTVAQVSPMAWDPRTEAREEAIEQAHEEADDGEVVQEPSRV